MTDRELLELAAKAGGIELRFLGGVTPFSDGPGMIGEWNPLKDDGDALRLAVKLRLDMSFDKLHTVCVWCSAIDDWITEYCADGMGADIENATRRAIVRAAAEIGKQKP